MFSLPITKAINSPRKHIGRLFYPAWRGLQDEVFTEDDFDALVKAYKSWPYICGNINSNSVARQNLGLYVAKGPKTKLFSSVSTKPISKKLKNKIYAGKTSISSLPCVMKSVDIERVTDHQYLNLMRNVNRFLGNFGLWHLTQLYLELTGNSYWYLSLNEYGIPTEIWPLQAQRMRIIPDKKNYIKGYIYKLSEEIDSYEKFEEKEIVHFKFSSPTSFYYGMAPLVAAAEPYLLNQKMNTYEAAIFRNMGRLEGAFVTEQRLNDKEFERLKEQININWVGESNQGKSPLMEKGVKFQPFALSPREINYSLGRKFTREEIFGIYGVPQSKIFQDAKYSNAFIADYEYMKETVTPRCLLNEGKINDQVMPLYDENLFVMYDEIVPQNRELTLKENIEYVKAGILAPDEIRVEELGKDPIGLDKPLIPFNVVPAGQRQLPAPTEEEEKEEKYYIQIAERIADKVKKFLGRHGRFNG